MIKLISYIVVGIVAVVLLSAAIKGDVGSPLAYQNDRSTVVTGPFESSGSTSRFALTEALVEDGSVFLNEDQARFASPDLVFFRGKFFSIFTPGVSFLGVPLYILGSNFGDPQLGAYTTVALFSLLNIFILAALSRKLGASTFAGLIAAVVFVFATNAYSYAMTYTQHIMSTTVILSSLILAFGKPNILKNILIGALFGLGVLLDIPNIFMLIPLILYVLGRHIENERKNGRLLFRVKMGFVGLLLGLLPLLYIFASYNFSLTDSYNRLGEFIGRVDYEEARVKKEEALEDPYGVKLPFNTRLFLTGFYTLFISDERSWLFYSPVVLLGILGAIASYREKETKTFTTVTISILAVNLLIYSMFPDPWGGWGFGPRYLIPAAALLCTFLGVAITRYGRNLFFLLAFIITFLYSVFISVAGVLTTTQIPPKGEVIGEHLKVPWTFAYNMQLLSAERVGSLIYNLLFVRIMPAMTYAYILMSIVVILTLLLYLGYFFEGRKKT